MLRWQIPGATIISLSDPADVAKVLQSEPKYPQQRQFLVLDYYREKRQKIPGVFFLNGPEWYRRRSVLSKRMISLSFPVDFFFSCTALLLFSYSAIIWMNTKEMLFKITLNLRGGLMVSALDSGASGPGSSPGRGHCVVFLGKTLNSHSASLHPGV